MRFQLSNRLIIFSGLAIGALGSILVRCGNPPNMGMCVACFMRDVVGALGLHRAGAAQCLRPEIPGFVVGSFIASYAFREFRSRGGSAPLVRFLIGAFVMIGAFVFLGCPIRAVLRLAGGGLNGLTGLLGTAFGATLGVFFLRRKFTLGRSAAMAPVAGWIAPALALGLVLLGLARPVFGEGGPVYSSVNGPASMHVPVILGLAAGALVGFLAQRTRLCFVGGLRDIMMFRDAHLFSGITAVFVGALALTRGLDRSNCALPDNP